MGLFDIFCSAIAGGADAQDDISQHGAPTSASRWSERQARGHQDDNAAAGWFGYAGRAAQHETDNGGRRHWFW